MHGGLVFLVGLGILLGEAVLMQLLGATGLAFQFWIPITFWIGLRSDFASSTIVLAALLPFMLLTSGAPAGFWIPGVALVYLGLRPLGLSPRNLTRITQGLIAMALALIHATSMAVLLLIFSPGSLILGSIGWNLFWAVPLVGISAPLVFWFLEQVEALISPRQAGIRLSKQSR